MTVDEAGSTPHDGRHFRWAFLLPAIVALAVGCGRPEDAPAAADGTPVILISVDTLRSDRLPIYGYKGVETPALDRLRAQSILFERAYSHIPLTFPSHSSMLTGMLPPEHAVRDNVGYRLETARLPYLPRLLKERGYATGAAVSAYVLRGTTGLADGFDWYDDAVEVTSGEALGALQRDGSETLQVTTAWLESVADRPFFLFFHIYEPHTPYEPPAPYARRYQDPYDGEVAYADAIVGRLLDQLRALGLFDRSLILFVSDHGEALGEHGQPAHEVLIYREVIQVPLLVKLPEGRRAGESVERPVQLIDLAPTVAELIGLELPPTLRGSSLLGEGPAEPQIYSESFYPRLHFGWAEQRSIVTDRHHYLHGPDDEIYDLIADPAETSNLIRQFRRRASELREAAFEIGARFEAPSESDPEVTAKLAALGYLAGTVDVEEGAELDDPRSKMGVLTEVARGLELTRRQQYDAAVEAFERVVAQEPRLVDAWGHLGKARQRLGQLDAALEAYREALRLSSGAPQIALSAAELFFERREFEEARQHAELAATSHPVAHDLLAQIALEEDDLEAASLHVGRALATRGSRVGPLVTAAELALAEDDLEKALESTDRALAEFGDRTDRQVLRGLYFVRGSVYARRGRELEATAAFLAEIELSPDALPAYSHLALVYALTGQGGKVGNTLRQMVEANPTAAAHAEAVRVLRQLGDEQSAAALLAQARQRWPTSESLVDLR